MRCDDVVFCRLCGAFSDTRSRLLRAKCPKRPIGNTKKTVLQKMLRGLGPYKAREGEENAGVPIQFCWWLDPSVGDTFVHEPGGGRRKRLAREGSSQDAQVVAQDRPLWTGEARERLVQEIDILAGREVEARRARVQERVARLALELEGPSSDEEIANA